MKRYWRWIVFGLVAVGVLTLLLLVGSNKKLRQKLTALLIQEKAKTEINNLKDKAIVAKTRADSGKISAEEAENEANSAEEAILIGHDRLGPGRYRLKTVNGIENLLRR